MAIMSFKCCNDKALNIIFVMMLTSAFRKDYVTMATDSHSLNYSDEIRNFYDPFLFQ